MTIKGVWNSRVSTMLFQAVPFKSVFFRKFKTIFFISVIFPICKVAALTMIHSLSIAKGIPNHYTQFIYSPKAS